MDHVGRGGIGRYVVDLATLVGDGADVALAIPEGGASPGAGAPISIWFPRPRDRRRRSVLRAAATGLVRAAKGTARGDVAWLQLGLRPRYELALAVVLRLRGVRLVATVHNRAPHTGARSGRAVTAAARLCHRVVVHTRELEEWGTAQRLRWVRLPFLTPDLSAAIRHGASPAEGLDRDGLGIPAEAVVVLFLGYLRRYKGPDVLLEALAQVRAADGSTRLHVVVAGAPTGDLDLAQVARDLHLGSGLTLRSGWLADEEMSALLDVADAVVLPYRTIDNSGIAALARERALPVVASDLPLMRETFGAEAAYVRPGDVEDLTGALRRLPGNLVAMRDAARAAVETSAAAPISDSYHFLLAELALRPRGWRARGGEKTILKGKASTAGLRQGSRRPRLARGRARTAAGRPPPPR